MLHLRTPHPGRSHCKEGSRRLAHLWEGPSPWVLLVGAAGPQAPQLPMGTRDGAGAQANQLWGCTSVLVGGFDSPPPRPLSALLGLGRSLPSHASDLPKTCCSGLTSVQIRPAAGGSSTPQATIHTRAPKAAGPDTLCYLQPCPSLQGPP